jgi:peptidoglycan-associated lipoprotein
MKLDKFLKLSIVIIAAFGLAACSTAKKPTQNMGGAGSGVETSGAGAQGSSFGLNDENSPNRYKAPYNQTYHFDFDKFDVTQEDVASINAQANYLSTHPKAKVRLEGNADDRGSREYNIALGWKRARAIADVLKQQGVANSQINMVSYGKEKPVAFGHDESSYRLNRRTDLIYEAK